MAIVCEVVLLVIAMLLLRGLEHPFTNEGGSALACEATEPEAARFPMWRPRIDRLPLLALSFKVD